METKRVSELAIGDKFICEVVEIPRLSNGLSLGMRYYITIQAGNSFRKRITLPGCQEINVFDEREQVFDKLTTYFKETEQNENEGS